MRFNQTNNNAGDVNTRVGTNPTLTPADEDVLHSVAQRDGATDRGRGAEEVNVSEPSIYDRPIEGHGGAKYLRRVRPADGKGEPIMVDVYCVIEAFGITCPALQHALKKILACGQRGKGSRIDDIHGTFDAMWRALELEKQREAAAAAARGPDADLNGKGAHCGTCGQVLSVEVEGRVTVSSTPSGDGQPEPPSPVAKGG